MRNPDHRPVGRIETAIVGGVTMHYIPGDTTPPPAGPMRGWRKCRSCGDEYPVETGKTCGCWSRDYEKQQSAVTPPLAAEPGSANIGATRKAYDENDPNTWEDL